jgi:hypothetical protein
LARVLPALPGGARYAAAGRVAQAVLEQSHLLRELQHPWAEVMNLEVQDWRLEPRRES